MKQTNEQKQLKRAIEQVCARSIVTHPEVEARISEIRAEAEQKRQIINKPYHHALEAEAEARLAWEKARFERMKVETHAKQRTQEVNEWQAQQVALAYTKCADTQKEIVKKLLTEIKKAGLVMNPQMQTLDVFE